MKEPKFKEGDWCFCEFALSQIKKTKENRITSVTNGVIEQGSFDLSDRCYPLDIRIKRISDEVAYFSKKFHAIKLNSLNHPDINEYLVNKWIEMCECNDDDKLQHLYDDLSDFYDKFIKKIEDLKADSINGVSIFRR